MAGCPSCGRESADDARFCSFCGAALATVEPSREVRKVVTVLFADVVGSTALGEATDPEALRARMRRYFEDLRRIVERHGGTVEKFAGDAIMAVFGTPVAHEDDALRAVRAASEMRAAIADHGLEARIGVNTGEVVVGGAGETLVTGDAVNVAARLEQAAPPGEAIIGAETRLLVRDAVRVEPTEPLVLKGKSEPVDAFRLLEVLSGAEARRTSSRDSARRARARAAAALARLRGRGRGPQLPPIHAARSRRHRQVATGCRLPRARRRLGRRLARALSLLRGGHHVLAARGDARSNRDRPGGDRRIDPRGDAGGRPPPARGSFGGGPAGGSRRRPAVGRAGVRRPRRARRRPLADAPIFLLVVARTELLDERPGWGGGKLNATSLLLEPLGETDRERLIDNLLGDASLDEATRERIADASEGNPLFVEEMLAMVRELGDSGEAVDVPPTIHALLQARLDALADHERLVVGHAAIEGEVFHRGSVVALAEDDLQPSLEDSLSSLVRKELIRPESSLIPGEDAFRFRHILIRDAAYGAMPKKVRARLHEQFAGWLEGARVTSFELDEILGYHLEQAVSLRVELGQEGEAERELAVRAGAKLTAAGQGALGRADYSAAIGLLERAVDHLGDDDQVRLEALSDLADALWRRGELERAEDVLTRAIEGARRTGNARVEARARLALNSHRVRVDPDSSVEDELEQALEIAASLERAGDLSTLARAYTEIGMCRFMLGRSGEGEADLEMAADVARRAGDAVMERQALTSRLRPTAWGPTPAAGGIAFCTTLLESETANASDRAHALQVRALFHAMQGDFDDARSSAWQSWAAIEEFGLELLKGIHLLDVGVAVMVAGDLGAAATLLRRGHELLVEIGDTGLRSTLDAVLADVEVRLGRIDEAAWLAEQSRTIASVDDLDAQPRWRASLALVLASRGEQADAEGLAREAVALAEPTDFLPLKAVVHDALGEVLATGGKTTEATAAVERAISLHEEKGNVVSAERSRTVLHELRGS